MTITLELTPDEEAQLRVYAARKGISAEEYVRTALHNQFQRDAQAATPPVSQVAP